MTLLEVSPRLPPKHLSYLSGHKGYKLMTQEISAWRLPAVFIPFNQKSTVEKIVAVQLFVCILIVMTFNGGFYNFKSSQVLKMSP